MDDAIRLRVRESPVGGSRIAFSYLATVVGLLLGGLVWAAWVALTDVACDPAGHDFCGLGWLVVGGFVGPALGVAVAAWAFRLGWEWWLVLVAGAVTLALAPGLPGALPAVALGLAAALLPALAGAATWGGPTHAPWRPWVIGGAGALALAISAAWVTLG